MKKPTLDKFSQFYTAELSEQEMNVVFGGKRPKGKSKDKDVFDEEDED